MVTSIGQSRCNALFTLYLATPTKWLKAPMSPPELHCDFRVRDSAKFLENQDHRMLRYRPTKP
jgi:hypothetical protein